MATKPTDVTMLAEEYQILAEEVGIATSPEITDGQIERLKRLLAKEGDWSSRAAEELLYLVRHYGIFMLRNALALSIALGIEDGEAGF
jgi:hypothetical protein